MKQSVRILSFLDQVIKPVRDLLVRNQFWLWLPADRHDPAAAARYGEPDYLSAGCGIGREATLYLTSRGVRVTGTDSWSWDAPFGQTAKRYGVTKNSALIWEGHKASREIGYTHIEKLHNWELLPDSGFLVSCFPVKIKSASAGWTRVVAILEETI